MSDRGAVFAANVAALGLQGLAPGPHERWREDWSGAWPSIAIETEAGQSVTLHSRRAPIDEARAQLTEARGDVPWPSLVVLLGAGLGYAVDVIEADAPADTHVVAIEPFAPVAAAMLSRRDWRPLVDAGRLTMVVGPAFAGAGDLWRAIEPRGSSPLVVEHPVIARVRPDAIAAARKIWDRASFDAAANNEARETLGGRYLVNTLFNLPRIIRGRDLRGFAGAGRGRAAVVCGAGPSLNHNLETMRAHRDDVALVAVDTALRPMLEAGLTPDFVVALDPAVLNARHLSGLSLPKPPLLVCEAALDPSAFDSFGDDVAFFRVGGNDPWPWLLEQGVDVPILAAWGSVLTSAFAFAEMLDCDPIVLAGADLAWTGNQPYCRGTAFEFDWGGVVLRGQPLPDYWRRLAARKATEHALDIDDQPTDTAPHLVAFRDWIVDRAAKSGRKVINLTGAGLLHGPAVRQGSDLFDAVSAAAAGRDPADTARGTGPDRQRGPTPDLDSLVARLGTLRDDEPPLADWIASYSRSLDRAMLDLALNTGASTRPIESRPSLPRALLAFPEAIAIVRAARDDMALPEWATTSPAWDLARARTGATTVLAALLRRARLGVSEARGDRLPHVGGNLHLLYNLEWPQPVLEAAAALVIETADRLRISQPGTGTIPRLRQTPRAATLAASTSPRQAERRAQVFLASLWLVDRTADCSDDMTRVALHLIDHASAAIDQPLAGADARLRATARNARDGVACWRAAVSIPTTTLIETLRGSVLGQASGRPCLSVAHEDVRVDLSWDTNSIDRDVLMRSYLGAATHRVLSDEGLPRCLIATPGPDGTAIATPRGQTASYRVEGGGAFERMAEWPAAIVGEIHGEHGQMAWSYTTEPVLLSRRSDTGHVETVGVTFQTYAAVWWQNLVVLTTSEGVWTWVPGAAPIRLADLPPAVIARLDGDAVEVDPLPLESGRLRRVRLGRGWTINLRSRAVTDRALESVGQRWLAHRTDERSAISFPQADVVRIEQPSVTRSLVWPSPRAAIWIGRSLLVNTTSGDVVLFDGLVDTLTSSGS